MTVTNSSSGTRIDEIARGIFRITTPVPPSPAMPLGFSFSQFLIAAEQPLLFHTGPRAMFQLVCEAVKTVLPLESLRYVGFSHGESDETGSLGEWLDLAPRAQALCGQVGAMISASDVRERPVKALAHGERLDLGSHEVTWFDAPHVPHGWDAGFLGEVSTRTLFCSDLFTQAGADNPPVTEQDLVGPSEAMRGMFDYYAHGPNTAAVLSQLAAFEPRVLAAMHGSCFSGDGRAALLDLKHALAARAER